MYKVSSQKAMELEIKARQEIWKLSAEEIREGPPPSGGEWVL